MMVISYLHLANRLRESFCPQLTVKASHRDGKHLDAFVAGGIILKSASAMAFLQTGKPPS